MAYLAKCYKVLYARSHTLQSKNLGTTWCRQYRKFSLNNSFSYRVAMVDGQGDLEDQLAEVKKKSAEIADRKEDLRIIEDLGAQMEEALILDNK